MSEENNKPAPKSKAKTVTLQNVGACLIRIGKVDVLPEKTVDVDESYINSQAAKYHFYREELEFYDDPKRTREFIAELAKVAKKEPEKSIEELEKGKTIG